MHPPAKIQDTKGYHINGIQMCCLVIMNVCVYMMCTVEIILEFSKYLSNIIVKLCFGLNVLERK